MVNSEEGLEELKKLSPAERIKRLKELEEARKREIEEAEQLIKESEQELADDKQKMPIPEARATDLSTLTTAEEKDIVATHHFLAKTEATVTSASAVAQPQPSLEEVTAEAPTTQQPQNQQSGFQKPEYAIGTERQRSAMGEYLSSSQQTVTGSARDDSPIEEKIKEFYKDRAVTGADAGDPQQKYFGTRQQVTGGYEMRKAEEGQKKELQETYRRKAGGPA